MRRNTLLFHSSLPQHRQPLLRRHFLQAFQQSGAGSFHGRGCRPSRGTGDCTRLIIAMKIGSMASIMKRATDGLDAPELHCFPLTPPVPLSVATFTRLADSRPRPP